MSFSHPQNVADERSKEGTARTMEHLLRVLYCRLRDKAALVR